MNYVDVLYVKDLISRRRKKKKELVEDRPFHDELRSAIDAFIIQLKPMLSKKKKEKKK